jgi:hypothetical protein
MNTKIVRTPGSLSNGREREKRYIKNTERERWYIINTKRERKDIS